MQRIKKAYAESGDLKIIPETPPLDGSENWEQGRGAYYELDNDPNTGDPLALDIDREQDNYFKNVISSNIKHWQENSYPIWFDDIEYPKNATVKYTDGNIYVSKVDNNTALPTDTNNWVNFEDFGGLNINTLPDKTTPVDTDNLALQETGGLLKKLSFANLKATLKTYFDTLYPSISGYPAFSASTTSQTFTANTLTKLACNIESYDNTNAYNNTTNFRFTPQKAGKYRITVRLQSTNIYAGGNIAVYKNGVNFSRLQGTFTNPYTDTVSGSITLELNGTTDYVEAYGSWTSNNTAGSTFQAEYIVGV